MTSWFYKELISIWGRALALSTLFFFSAYRIVLSYRSGAGSAVSGELALLQLPLILLLTLPLATLVAYATVLYNAEKRSLFFLEAHFPRLRAVRIRAYWGFGVFSVVLYGAISWYGAPYAHRVSAGVIENSLGTLLSGAVPRRTLSVTKDLLLFFRDQQHGVLRDALIIQRRGKSWLMVSAHEVEAVKNRLRARDVVLVDLAYPSLIHRAGRLEIVVEKKTDVSRARDKTFLELWPSLKSPQTEALRRDRAECAQRFLGLCLFFAGLFFLTIFFPRRQRSIAGIESRIIALIVILLLLQQSLPVLIASLL